MAAIWYQINKRGDLPHYYLVSRKTDPLEIYFKNDVWYTFGTMIYQETKKRKETLKTLVFNKDTVVIEDCMKIIM